MTSAVKSEKNIHCLELKLKFGVWCRFLDVEKNPFLRVLQYLVFFDTLELMYVYLWGRGR